MRLVRGRLPDLTADRDATKALLRWTAATGTPGLRVWCPARQLAFGRLDTRRDGYERARELATRQGYPPIDRSVGGHAVAYTGTTLAFAHTLPVSNPREGLDDRYASAVERLVDTFRELGINAEPGEPPNAYCPGQYSVRVKGGGKLAGVAQRIQTDAAMVAGCIVVRDGSALRELLVPVYDALDLPLDPDTVSTVAEAGGPDDPKRVGRRLEVAFADGTDTTIRRITDFVTES